MLASIIVATAAFDGFFIESPPLQTEG